MNSLDLSKPVKFKNPQTGEEDLIFIVTNYNEIIERCYINLISPLPGLNESLSAEELVSITEIENIKEIG